MLAVDIETATDKMVVKMGRQTGKSDHAIQRFVQGALHDPLPYITQPSEPHLVLPPGSPEDFPDLLDYFREKGLDVASVNAHPGCVYVILDDLKPPFFNKVVIPELRRRAEKWNRRITYRFTTKCKEPRRVNVHLDFWLKVKKPEVIRFPS
jgi:hypothetical protein